MEEYISTNIRLTAKQHERLRKESYVTKKSQAEIVREALELRWAQVRKGGEEKPKAKAMWETLTVEEQAVAEEYLKDYAGSDGHVGRMWEMYEEGARGVDMTVDEYQKEISYNEYVKRITEDWS